MTLTPATLLVLLLCLLAGGCAGVAGQLKDPDPAVRLKALSQVAPEDLADKDVLAALEGALWDKSEDVAFGAAQRLQAHGAVDRLGTRPRVRAYELLRDEEGMVRLCAEPGAAREAKEQKLLGTLSDGARAHCLLTLADREALKAACSRAAARSLVHATLTRPAAQDRDLALAVLAAYDCSEAQALGPYLRAARGDPSALMGDGKCDEAAFKFGAAVASAKGAAAATREAVLVAFASSGCSAGMDQAFGLLARWPEGEAVPKAFVEALRKTDPRLAGYFVRHPNPADALRALRRYRAALARIKSLRAAAVSRMRGSSPPEALLVDLPRLALSYARVQMIPEAMAALAVADACGAYWVQGYLDQSLKRLSEATEAALSGGGMYALQEVQELQNKARAMKSYAFTDTLDELQEFRLRGALTVTLKSIAGGKAGIDQKDLRNLRDELLGGAARQALLMRGARAPEQVGAALRSAGEATLTIRGILGDSDALAAMEAADISDDDVDHYLTASKIHGRKRLVSALLGRVDSVTKPTRLASLVKGLLGVLVSRPKILSLMDE